MGFFPGNSRCVKVFPFSFSFRFCYRCGHETKKKCRFLLLASEMGIMFSGKHGEATATAAEDDFFVNLFLCEGGLHALKRFQENIDSIVITPAKSCLLNYLPFSNQSKKTECVSISVSLVWQLGTVSELQHREDGLSNHDFAALRFIFRSMRAVQILRALHKSDIIICVRNK